MARAPADDNDKPQPEEPPLPKVSRHIQPVGPRVLVRIVKEADRSEAGLFLPAGVKESNAAALLGEVVEVARTLPKAESPLPADDEEVDDDDDTAAVRADFGKNVSGIPLGANVLFEKERGVTVPWDEGLRILEVRHVLALVDIISQDEIQ
jgi:co-chaperonin GroES (HSP10)